MAAQHLQFSLRAVLLFVGIVACISWPTAHIVRAVLRRPPPFVRASGVVTLNGAPLDSATVSFFPVNGTDPPAAGTTDLRGRFELRTYVSPTRIMKGALPGDYMVTVHKGIPWPSVMPSTSRIGAEEVPPEVRARRPSKYEATATSGLSATVVAGGNNSFTFSLVAD